jgi:hypothetical protein
MTAVFPVERVENAGSNATACVFFRRFDRDRAVRNVAFDLRELRTQRGGNSAHRPAAVSHLFRDARRPDDVGEDERGQNAAALRLRHAARSLADLRGQTRPGVRVERR